MPITLLVTTFDTWLPHQVSNASDDLVRLWRSDDLSSDTTQPLSALSSGSTHKVHVLHQLPVDTGAAYAKILQAIEQYRPNYVIACGMAESRSRLSLEARAVYHHATQDRATQEYLTQEHLTQDRATQDRAAQDSATQDAPSSTQSPSTYWTPISLTGLCSLRKSLRRTGISYDAGKFVCNETYYHLLKHHSEDPAFPRPLFLHVPLLTPENQADLLHDFQRILQFLSAL